MRRSIVLVPGLLAALLPGPASAQSVADMFQKVRDSVVVIRATVAGPADGSGGPHALQMELGSGVLISPNGAVLTAAHVVQIAERIQVELAGGEKLLAKVVGSVPAADLALLQLERAPMNPSPAVLGDSDAARIGDEIFIVGAPLGMSHTLTVGHVGGRRVVNDMFGGFSPAELLQTDAAINEGNSGGPMFDMQGKVIGIVSHVISSEVGSGGLGFVVTANMAKELLLSGRSTWSGMEGYQLKGDLARAFNVPQERAILVQRVAAGSPAARVGLLAGTQRVVVGAESFLIGGDVILEVQGINVADGDGAAARIRKAIDAVPPGAAVTIVVIRGGRRVELQGPIR